MDPGMGAAGSARRRSAYRKFLEDYAAEQQRAGPFPLGAERAPAQRRTTGWTSSTWCRTESRISLIVALGFFVICLVNTIGLLLAKFMRRAPRSACAARWARRGGEIYRQFLIEAGTVGAGRRRARLVADRGRRGRRGAAVRAGNRPARASGSVADAARPCCWRSWPRCIAAFYPTWRAAKVQPAWQLKSN